MFCPLTVCLLFVSSLKIEVTDNLKSVRGQTALLKTFIDFFDSIVLTGSKSYAKTFAKWSGLKASMLVNQC